MTVTLFSVGTSPPERLIGYPAGGPFAFVQCYSVTMDFTGKRVVLLGDSQMQGLARELSAILLQRGAAVVDVSAHVGMSLKTAQETLQNVANGYDVVIVSFGGNNPPATKERAVFYMNGLLSRMGGKEVAWMTVLPVADAALQVARGKMERWQKEHLPTKGVLVLDGRALASGIRRPDGLHLSSGGYSILAGRLIGAVDRASRKIPWVPIIGGLIAGIVAALARA